MDCAESHCFQDMLAVCANCQKQFVNVVMRENSFDKQLKMFPCYFSISLLDPDRDPWGKTTTDPQP